MSDREVYFLANASSYIEGEANMVFERVTNLEDDKTSQFEFRSVGSKYVKKFPEGNFFHLGERDQFDNANSHKKAKAEFYKNNMYRGAFLKKAENKDRLNEECLIAKEVHSYHVNVGHGNCSILTIKDSGKTHIWMIDCSDFDFTNKEYKRSNIQTCIDYIKRKNGLSAFSIDKFFLTHTHYDHFSGLNWLIDNGYIVDTEMWINLHYSWASPSYNSALAKLSSLDLTFVEPVTANSNHHIQLWHPEERTVRSLTPKYENDIVVAKQPNDSSIVYQFVFDDIRIVFPGDLEKSGWNDVNKCFPYLNGSTYYCISHHGSLNGHERTTCPENQTISNISQCHNILKRAILMGRDGAFPGIYNQQVLRDFRRVLVKSEQCPGGKSNCFVEVNLNTNGVIYY